MKDYQGVVFIPVLDDVEIVPYGEVMADIKKNRNPGNHKRIFAFFRQTFDMQDDFDNPEQWRKYMQMKAGHYELVVAPNGNEMYWPLSIDWDKLDEIEFKKLFTEIVNAFIKYYGRDLSDLQINSILEY